MPNLCIVNSSLPNSPYIPPPVGPTPLQVGPTRTYLTIAAAIAVAVGGDTIEVDTGTYNETIVSVRSGSLGNTITLKAAAGNLPVVTGYSNRSFGGFAAYEASCHMFHDYLTFGEGIEIRGNNTGLTSSWSSANPEHAIVVRGAHATVKFKVTGIRTYWLLVGNGAGTIQGQYMRLSGMYCSVAGTLSQGTPIDDASDGITVLTSLTAGGASNNAMCLDTLLEDSYFELGGHSSGLTYGTRLLNYGCLYDGSWESVWGATYGQKSYDSFGDDAVIDSCVFQNPGRQVDNPSTIATGIIGLRSQYRKCFALGGINYKGTGGFNIKSGKAGTSFNHISHCTAYGFTGEGIGCDDQDPDVSFGPVYIKNTLIVGCSTNPNFAKQAYPFYFQINQSLRGAWTTQLFVDGLFFDSNQLVGIFDNSATPTLNGVLVASGTLATMMASFPANFQNCGVVAPNFVSTSLPTSKVPATGIAQAQTNFRPQAAGLLSIGSGLTTVASNAVNTTTLSVTDGGWFRDAMGWSHLSGDDIYIEGVGTRRITAKVGNVLTLNSAVTVTSTKKIWLGTSATPNIGAVL